MKQYEVTRKFIGGILEGITITQIQTFKSTIGFKCIKPIGGSPYIIIDCKEVI
jgi:hypothetical protein